MYRQKGSNIILDDDNEIISGLIVRHLVLPNHVENSLKVLDIIASEISNKIYISLMSQYYPPQPGLPPTLNRNLNSTEYNKVLEHLEMLNFENEWIQEYDSHKHYRPSFQKEHPFE